jgi:hypothetical protein
VAKASAWLALVLLTACGGSAQTTPPIQQGTSGAAHSAGGSDGAAANGGVAGSPNGTDGEVAGAFHGHGGENAGTAGKSPDLPGAGAGPLSCSTPYAGPSGGPRSDGPADLGSCAAIPDSLILARYKDSSARVPQGLYYEGSESITFWNEPCSKSLDETVDRGATGGMGAFIDAYSNDWYHEAVYCLNGSVRRIERNLRCDYFDGTKLANPTPERLAFLASMLWWSENANLGGSTILGHSLISGGATDVVELCTLSVVYGDFGLCDQVQLESTKHMLRLAGSGAPDAAQFSIELGKPQVVRTLEGDCN